MDEDLDLECLLSEEQNLELLLQMYAAGLIPESEARLLGLDKMIDTYYSNLNSKNYSQ